MDAFAFFMETFQPDCQGVGMSITTKLASDKLGSVWDSPGSFQSPFVIYLLYYHPNVSIHKQEHSRWQLPQLRLASSGRKTKFIWIPKHFDEPSFSLLQLCASTGDRLSLIKISERRTTMIF